MLARLEQTDRQRVVVGHHVFAVGLHGVAARAFVEYRFHGAVGALRELAIERAGVHVVGNLQRGKVAEFVAVGQVIHRDDVVNAPGVQALDEVAADETGCARDNDSGHGEFLPFIRLT